MLLDPKSVRKPTSTQDALLLVAGQKLAEGTEADMRRLFDAEITNHRAIVELRVKAAGGDYQTKLRRS